jgi:metal-sulfur cluster biosynthetic enzyme
MDGVPAPPAEPFAFAGDPALRPLVTRALGRVIDPEMALNIVDLGLVRSVVADPAAVRVVMTLTSAACPVGELIVDDMKRELRAALGASCDVAVSITFEPAWTPERMSAKARLVMGWL